MVWKAEVTSEKNTISSWSAADPSHQDVKKTRKSAEDRSWCALRSCFHESKSSVGSRRRCFLGATWKTSAIETEAPWHMLQDGYELNWFDLFDLFKVSTSLTNTNMLEAESRVFLASYIFRNILLRWIQRIFPLLDLQHFPAHGSAQHKSKQISCRAQA